MEHTRIKFYSENDLSSAWYLTKATDVLEAFSEETAYSDINDVLELYNIQKYIKAQCKLLSWSETKNKEYEEKVDKFSGVIGRFASKMMDENFISFLEACDVGYSEDFWEITNHYKVYRRISPEVIDEALDQKKIYLRDLFQQPSIVKHYDSVLRNFMLLHPETAVLLVNTFFQKHAEDEHVLTFPDSLTLDDKEKIINEYISSTEANPNTVDLIGRSKTCDGLRLQPKTILAARKKHEQHVEALFSGKKRSGLEYGVSIAFSNQIDDVADYEYDKSHIRLTYNPKWIIENLDYPTLLNNFIYLFEFSDLHFRSNFVSKTCQSSVFEKIMGSHGKYDYPTSFSFNLLSLADSLKIRSYHEILKHQNIELLDVFQWFFQTYLLDEFSVENYRFNKPSEQTTYFEKCRFLLSEFDCVLKQYKLYVEEKEINQELLQVSTEHLFVDQMPSRISKKYLYLKADGKKATQCLFSEHGIFSYSPKTQKSYNSFIDVLLNEKLKIDDLPYAKQVIDWLLKNRLLYQTEEGFLNVAKEEIALLKDIYKNDVACSSYLERFRPVVNRLIEKGFIEENQSLFSKPEQEWLNYILNQSEFHNGLDLRNRYIHGTQPAMEEEAVHYENYCIILKCFVLAIIKINEEFCLCDDQPHKGSPAD